MISSSAAQKAGHSYPTENNVALAKPDNWKSQLALKLRVDQSRPEQFGTLIDNYIRGLVQESEDLDRSAVVSGCMANREGPMLADILKYEDVKHLCIQGPVDEGGWETLIEAMPDTFPVEALTLVDVHLDRSAIERLFKVLHGMPNLDKLGLSDVGVTSGIDLRGLAWPAWELKALEVTAVSGADVYPLVFKILEACKLRRLSFDETTAANVAEHARLGEALGNQTMLTSLGLMLLKRDDPNQFNGYTQCLRGNEQLEVLSLRETELPVRHFNALLEAVQQKNMRRIRLNGCELKESESERIQLSPIADMHSLWELDLSRNNLSADAIVSLLHMLGSSKTSLEHLILDENQINSETVAAMADFLGKNRTILRFSFVSAERTTYEEDRVLPMLTAALEQNTSLLRLNFNVPPFSRYHARMASFLKRNRNSFLALAMERGKHAFRNVAPSGFPSELVEDLFERGLTWRDHLSLSSTNQDSRDWRPEQRV